MIKNICLITLCSAAASLPAAAQQCMFMHHGNECLAVELFENMSLRLVKDTVIIDNGAVCRIAGTDSITFRTPATEYRKAGWWGNFTNGQSCYYPQHNQTAEDYVTRFDITATDGKCTNMEYTVFFGGGDDALEYYAQFNLDTDGGNHKYTKQTLTHRRKFTITVNSPINLYPDMNLLSNDVKTDMSRLTTGLPMEDVMRAVCCWSTPDGFVDRAMLPSSVLFGSYSDGHYAASLHDGTISCTVDMSLNADRSRVTGYTTRLTYPTPEEAKTDFTQYEEEDNRTDMSCTLENSTIIITETCDKATDEAMDDIIFFDISLHRPEYIICE